MESFFEKYPVPQQGDSLLVLNYGTAGFRARHENMDHVSARMAFIAAFESTLSNNHFVGLCVTASHNPECDNGVKFIQSNGSLPSSEFEIDVTRFINSEDPVKEFESFMSKYSKIKTPENCKPQKNLNQAYVLIGHDTRPSSARLVTIACEALQSIHASFYNFGVITTPQLNFYVRYFNIPQQYNYILKVSCHKTLKLTQDSYFSWFSSRFQLFLQSWETVRKENPSFNDLVINQTKLVIDGANGSGGHQFSYFIKLLDLINVKVSLFNDGSSAGSIINKDCGADYVKKQKKCPINIDSNLTNKESTKCCSFDGDADRLIYFAWHPVTNCFFVLDGDRILCLFAKTLLHIIAKAVAFCQIKRHVKPLHIACIHTGYSNGGAIQFLNHIFKGFHSANPSLEKLINWNIVACSTGVKHLAARAEEFDIAIYFESNGHGALFTQFDAVYSWGESLDMEDNKYFQLLSSYLRLFEWGEGDAMVNVLGVEASLAYMDMTLENWIQLYEDKCYKEKSVKLPRALLNKLSVDPQNETNLMQPESLRQSLKLILDSTGPASRAFIRPSGTEDVCRIYAETSSTDAAEKLADDYEMTILKHFNMVS